MSTTVVSTALATGLLSSEVTFRSRSGESGRVFTPLASPMLDSLALASSSRNQHAAAWMLQLFPQAREG